MPKYGFRITVLIARDSAINSNAKSIKISLPSDGGTYVLRPAQKGQAINKSRELVIQAKRFSSKEEATAVAQQIRRSLLLIGIRQRIGIGTQIEELPATALHFKMPCEPDTSQPSFKGVFDGLSPRGLSLSDKQTLALELYNAYHFETSRRTRFITLVIAVESLTKAPKRSANARACIDSFVESINSSQLDAEEKEELKNNLSNLKQKSIGKTCRELVVRYLGNKVYGSLTAEELFKECYKMRSQLVHSGRLGDAGRFLDPWTYNLDCLVSDLLLINTENV